ncbi:MAG: hypothetical protein AAGH70_00455 [Pseudomonadota bacterium]
MARKDRATECVLGKVSIAERAGASGFDKRCTEYTRKVGELGLEYEPFSAFSTDNSNATIRTFLRYMGLAERRPTGGKWVDIFGFEHDTPSAVAPGWDRVFDLD